MFSKLKVFRCLLPGMMYADPINMLTRDTETLRQSVRGQGYVISTWLLGSAREWRRQVSTRVEQADQHMSEADRAGDSSYSALVNLIVVR